MAGDSRGPPLLLPPTSLDSEAFCNFIDHGCGAESHGVSPPSWCAVQAALAKRRHEDHRRLFIPRLTRWVKKTVSTHQLPTSARVSSSMYLQITTAPPRPAVNHAAELPWLTDNRSTVSGSSSPTAHLLQTIKEPSQPQCQSAFFRLPLEVRLQVYDCLLFGRYILMLLSYGPLPGHNSDTWYLWHTSSAIADSSDISHLDVFRRQIDAAVIPEREDYQRRLEFNKRVRERTEKLQVAITRTCRQA